MNVGNVEQGMRTKLVIYDQIEHQTLFRQNAMQYEN